MRRFVSLAVILFFAIPFGMSVSGCKKALTPQFCDAGDSGPTVGQVASIELSPSLSTTGESLGFGQIGQALNATSLDCKGNSVSVKSYTYATSNMAIADINPSTGQVCAGSWNRNTGGGVANYTTCTPFSSTLQPAGYLAYVTATAEGVVSNQIAVYIHPIVTGVVLTAPQSLSSSCSSTDPTSDCCPSGTSTTVYTPTPASYSATACYSQGSTVQLAAKVYQNGTTNAADNITCQVGHLTFSPQTAAVSTIDENGVSTAGQPGSTVVTAAVSNSSTASSAGFLSTCPPASIVLAATGQTSDSFSLGLNNTLALTVTALDTLGKPLTGLNLEYSSTTPTTLPVSSASITPQFPGAATITAACQPPTCNPSPFSQLGYLGNGKPVTSNGLTVSTTGTSTSVIYAGSTESQYLFPMDFSTGLSSSLIKLPYVPNSMVISQDGSTLYLGSSTGLMTVTTASNTASAANTAVPGVVLAVSPDGSTVVVTDPVRLTVSLYSTSSSAVTTATNGVGTHAVWSPDSTMVYITLANGGGLLTHSTANNWQTTATPNYADAVMTVPGIGAYFADQAPTATYTEGRSYCPASTITTPATLTSPATVSNSFAPLVDQNTQATNDKLAATTDGKHILGATVYGTPTLNDMDVTLPTEPASGTTTIAECPIPGNGPSPGYFASTNFSTPLAGFTPAAITGVVPSLNSAVAFVTYSLASGATVGGQMLPFYTIPTTGKGTLSNVTLGNGAAAGSAPESGVFATDNLNFYVGTGAGCSDGTSADNDIHIFSLTGTTPTETGILSPNLPFSGSACAPATPTYAPVNMMVQKPKKTTS